MYSSLQKAVNTHKHSQMVHDTSQIVYDTLQIAYERISQMEINNLLS